MAPLKLPLNAPNALHTALAPLVDGDSLVAVRVYYVSTTNDGALEVGVVERGGSKAFREALTEVIREELGVGSDVGGRRAYPLPSQDSSKVLKTFTAGVPQSFS